MGSLWQKGCFYQSRHRLHASFVLLQALASTVWAIFILSICSIRESVVSLSISNSSTDKSSSCSRLYSIVSIICFDGRCKGRMKYAVTVATIAPKKTIDPTIIQAAPIISDIPFTGISAIPAVEKAATPQYNALPNDVIVVPSIPRSPRYIPVEKSSHKMINRKVILRIGVCLTTSRRKL